MPQPGSTARSSPDPDAESAVLERQLSDKRRRREELAAALRLAHETEARLAADLAQHSPSSRDARLIDAHQAAVRRSAAAAAERYALETDLQEIETAISAARGRLADGQGRRVNIYIPQPLAHRLEAVKDRVNVSKVCQEAIEDAVGREELVGSDERRARIVHRLLTLEARSARMYRRGLTDGETWAETHARWSALKQVATDPLGKVFVHQRIPQDVSPGDEAEGYSRGFLDGVRGVYNMVKDVMEASTKSDRPPSRRVTKEAKPME